MADLLPEGFEVEERAEMKDILLPLLFVAGWFTHGWYDDSLNLAIERTALASQVAAAKEIAKIEVQNTTINKRFKDVIKTEFVYSTCKHSKDAFLLVNEAFK